MSDSLFVTSWGEGSDVVLVHGLGASSRYWEALRAAGGGYRATAPDLLGFGRSPSPPEAAYDVECHLAALAPHLPPRAVVVAHSTGAILAAALAARHPERVASMLLVGLPAYPDEEAARRSVGSLGLLARLTVDGHRAARLVCESMCRFRPLAVALAPWVVRDLPPSIASDGARHTWVSYSRTLQRVVIEHRAVEDLRATAVPVTLLHGRDDRAAPPRFVQALADRSAGGRNGLALRVVAGNHHLAVRRPSLVADALAQRLDEETRGDSVLEGLRTGHPGRGNSVRCRRRCHVDDHSPEALRRPLPGAVPDPRRGGPARRRPGHLLRPGPPAPPRARRRRRPRRPDRRRPAARGQAGPRA